VGARKRRLATRRSPSLLLASTLASLALGACASGTREAEERVENARDIGETRLFDFAARSPLEWIGNDAIVFVSIDGTATIDLATGAVAKKADPSVVPPNPIPQPAPGKKLSPGVQYGPWKVTGDSRFLIADESGDVRCGALLLSPDGSYVARNYIVTDRMAESSRGQPAVIRLR